MTELLNDCWVRVQLFYEFRFFDDRVQTELDDFGETLHVQVDQQLQEETQISNATT